MARADREFAVRTKGLGALNRSLGKISKDLKKESVGHLRSIAREVRDEAKPLTPVRSGALRSSLRYQASARGASVSSALPYAGLVEHGGTISPRGTPITFQSARMLGRAVQQNTDNIEEQLGDLLDQIGRRNGFR